MQPSVQGQQFAHYQLIKMLGEGSFAQVFQAQDRKTGKEVALKIFKGLFPDQTSLDELGKEAEITKSLIHPHIVRVHQFAVEGNKPYLEMDFVPFSWRDKHALGAPLPLDLVVKYTRELSAALQYAHDNRVVHRDLKPPNLLLNHKGDLLLGDFGIARMLTVSGLDFTQHVAGTLQYMAPEAFEGVIERACDQYSLGVIVYEWLTGKRPFEGNNITELWRKHVYDVPGSLRRLVPSISQDIEDVVLQALSKKPHQRFPSVQSFATKLGQVAYPQVTKPSAPIPAPNPPVASPVQQVQPAVLPPIVVKPPAPVPAPNPPVAPPVRAAPPVNPAPSPQVPGKPAASPVQQVQPAAPPPVPVKPSNQPPASPPAPVPAPPAQGGPANPPPPVVIGPAKPLQPPAPGPAQGVPGQAPPSPPQPVQAAPGAVIPPSTPSPVQGNSPPAPSSRPWNPLAGAPPGSPQPAPAIPRPLPGSSQPQQPAVPPQTPPVRPPSSGLPPIQGQTVPVVPPPSAPPTGGSGIWSPGSTGNNSAVTIPAQSWQQGQARRRSSRQATVPDKARKGTRVCVYRAHASAVKEIHWFPYGDQMLSLDEHMAHSWESIQGAPIATVALLHRNGVWSPDRTHVAYPGPTGISVYYMLSQPPTLLSPPYQGHRGEVRAIAWACGNSYLASSGDDHTIHVWDAASGKLVSDSFGGSYQGIYGVHVRPITHLAPSPDGRLIASAEEGGDILIWDPKDGHPVNSYTVHREKMRNQGNISALEWSLPDGEYMASQAGREVHVWEVASGKTLSTREVPPSNPLILWSPDGRHIASRGLAGRGIIDIWDHATGKTVLTCDCGDSLTALAWSPNGKVLAAGAGRTVYLWDARSGKRLLSYRSHPSSVTSIAWSPDGKQIASGDSGDQAAAQTGNATNAQVHVWLAGGIEQPYWQVVLDRAVTPFSKAQRKLGKSAFWQAVGLVAFDVFVFLKMLGAFYPSFVSGWMLLALLPVALVAWGLLGKRKVKRTLLQLALIPLAALWGVGGWGLGASIGIFWLSIFARIIFAPVFGAGVAWLHWRVLRRL